MPKNEPTVMDVEAQLQARGDPFELGSDGETPVTTGPQSADGRLDPTVALVEDGDDGSAPIGVLQLATSSGDDGPLAQLHVPVEAGNDGDAPIPPSLSPPATTTPPGQAPSLSIGQPSQDGVAFTIPVHIVVRLGQPRAAQ
jgi:hypothetical protein